MSAEEFWEDDPQLFVSYRTSFINKKKREMEELDYKCWLQGLYTYHGNGLLFRSLKQLISNIVASMFKGKKDTSKIGTYPDKPYNEQAKEKEKKDKREEQNQKYQNFESSLVYFGTLKQQYLSKLKDKNRKGE